MLPFVVAPNFPQYAASHRGDITYSEIFCIALIAEYYTLIDLSRAK